MRDTLSGLVFGACLVGLPTAVWLLLRDQFDPWAVLVLVAPAALVGLLLGIGLSRRVRRPDG